MKTNKLIIAYYATLLLLSVLLVLWPSGKEPSWLIGAVAGFATVMAFFGIKDSL